MERIETMMKFKRNRPIPSTVGKRKVRLSASIDTYALRIIEKIAKQENRTISNALNSVILKEGKARGLCDEERLRAESEDK